MLLSTVWAQFSFLYCLEVSYSINVRKGPTLEVTWLFVTSTYFSRFYNISKYAEILNIYTHGAPPSVRLSSPFPEELAFI